MLPTQTDLILLVLTNDSPETNLDTLQNALAEVTSRMGTATIAIREGDPRTIHHSTKEIRSADRIAVVPFSLLPLNLAELRTFLWFGGTPLSTPIFLGSTPTSIELGRWIRDSVSRSNPEGRVELVPPPDADNDMLDRLAAIAYRAGNNVLCAIRGDANRHEQGDSNEPTFYLAFTPSEYTLKNGTAVRGSMMRSHSEIEPWDWVSSESLSTWIVGRALRALNGPKLSFLENGEDDLLSRSFRSLTDRQHAILPSEYTDTLDSVAPTSMGSAALVYDADGKVPWDSLWTSFCDLAMAGGPPHRGTLLSNVPSEAIAEKREEYEQVVAELRRGIELASGLATCESATPGWVGVCCQDEHMAAWILRAIIVENILVRREGSVLYLPAGPGFRIEKEIKNVITAVAKTTHYWCAHLKTRQPPNPL
jgi:hypothetical protein